MRTLLYGVLLLVTTPALAQGRGDASTLTVALCPAGREVKDALFQQDFFAPDASAQRLLVLPDDDTPRGCVTTTVSAQRAPALQWAGLPDATRMTADNNAVMLQGDFSGAAPLISEIIIASADAQDASVEWLPLNTNVLPEFEVTLFGAEQRVSWTEDTMLCGAGDQSAGLFLQSDRQWMGTAPLQLEIAATGSGLFPIAIGDAARNASEQPLTLGTIEAGTRISYPFEVAANGGEPWTSLTLLCPAGEGRLQIQAIAAYPSSAGASQTIVMTQGRSAWLWSPQLWQQDPGQIWQLQQQQQLSDVYLTIPVTKNGRVENAEALALFLTEARRRKLRVWAVVGDRDDLLPQTRESLSDRLDAYLQYNRGAGSDARLSGVQLDIEPSLLPGFALAQTQWRDRYLATVGMAQQQLGSELPLDLLMPQWWGSHPDWSDSFLDALPQARKLSVTVRNYQTDVAALRQGAQPFLAWGQRAGVPVRIALESGRRPDAQRRHYAPDGSGGELWSLQVGEQPVLLLFGAAQSGLPGQAYRFTEESTVSGGHYSFAGDDARLQQVISELEPEWAAWSSFSGIALHGLEATSPGQNPGN